MADGVGEVARLRGKTEHGIGGTGAETVDTGRRVSVEDGLVLGERHGAGGVLDRLPVGVLGAPVHVVDGVTAHPERHGQFDQGLDLAQPGRDTG